MSAAPSIVQHVPGAATGSTITLTGTLGNLYVLLAWSFAATAANASDTAGNAWTKIATVSDVNTNVVAIYAAPITHAGATTISDVTAAGGLMDAVEVSGWSGNIADLAAFTLAVPSTTVPFNAGAAEQRILQPSLLLMVSEDQSSKTLVAGLDGVAATVLDTPAGMDSSYSWQMTQSTVPALVHPYVGATGTTTDDMAFAGVIIPNTDAPVAATFGGGDADDRYRYRNSQFVSHTSTLGTIRAGWPDDAMDFGLQDTGSDNVARMN